MIQEQPKIRIAEENDFSPEVITFLKSFAEVDVKSCLPSELKLIFENYDVFWFRLGYKIDASLFSPKTKLKILATPVTGIDHIDEDSCKKIGIQIACLKGETDFLKTVRATAELTIAITLALMRNIGKAINHTLAGGWNRDLFRGHELYGKTVGIIGTGRLGIITAGMYKAFGCKVIGFDIKQDNPEIDYVNSLNEIAEISDIISVHLSFNQSTKELIGNEFFKKVKPSAYFINTSRGGIVDEDALLEALHNKKLAGAALDVVQNEFKLSLKNPLFEYANSNNNLIITPHIGGNTFESFEKTEWFIARKINTFFHPC